jgi:acetyl esterase/lipase
VYGKRDEHSPIRRSFEGLPPLCVMVSEHEAIYDEACVLINSARAANVPVTVGMWRYMCHVWLFLGGFAPEGQQSIDFMCNWINEMT